MTELEKQILEFIRSHPTYNVEAIAGEFDNTDDAYYAIWHMQAMDEIHVDPITFCASVREV